MKATYKINHDLSLVKVNTLKLKIITIFSVLLNVGLGIGFWKYTHKIITVPSYVLIEGNQIVEKDIELNDSAIAEFMSHNGCVLPNIALAQAKIESANYTSAIARENKNLFGIKYHKCKYVKGEHRGHALYDSYRNNILCYIHVQNHYLKNIDGVYAAPGPYIQMIKDSK